MEVRCFGEDLGTPFFWRLPLLPHGCDSHEQCYVTAHPMPPSTLDSIQVDWAVYYPREDILSLAISWMFPVYPNGVLRHYQLRIGTLPIKNNQESGTALLLRTAIRVSEIKSWGYLLSCRCYLPVDKTLCAIILTSLLFSSFCSLSLSLSLSPLHLFTLIKPSAYRDKFIHRHNFWKQEFKWTLYTSKTDFKWHNFHWPS